MFYVFLKLGLHIIFVIIFSVNFILVLVDFVVVVKVELGIKDVFEV